MRCTCGRLGVVRDQLLGAHPLGCRSRRPAHLDEWHPARERDERAGQRAHGDVEPTEHRPDHDRHRVHVRNDRTFPTRHVQRFGRRGAEATTERPSATASACSFQTAHTRGREPAVTNPRKGDHRHPNTSVVRTAASTDALASTSRVAPASSAISRRAELPMCAARLVRTESDAAAAASAIVRASAPVGFRLQRGARTRSARRGTGAARRMPARATRACARSARSSCTAAVEVAARVGPPLFAKVHEPA